MNRKSILALGTALLLAACAAGEPAPAPAPQPAPESASREQLVTRNARVETVDLVTRQVLLRMDDNTMFSLVAGPEVRNLPQLAPGDVVRFEYFEAVAVRMADSASPASATSAVVATRAAEGAKPGAGAGAMVNMVVEFISYDPATHVATYRTQDGSVARANVRPEMRDFAATRKPGDRIDVTVTEAIAVAIVETAN